MNKNKLILQNNNYTYIDEVSYVLVLIIYTYF